MQSDRISERTPHTQTKQKQQCSSDSAGLGFSRKPLVQIWYGQATGGFDRWMDREGLWRRQSTCEDAIAGGTQVTLPSKETPVLPVSDTTCEETWSDLQVKVGFASSWRGADVTGPLPLPFRPGSETLAGMKGLGFLPARSSSRPGREIEKM